MSISRIWQHTSDTPALLGRFSTGYGLVALGALISPVIWALIIWQFTRLMSYLKRLPLRLRQSTIIALSVATWVLWWQLRIENQLLMYLTFTVLCIQALLIVSLPAHPDKANRWIWALFAGMGVVLFIPFSISALGGRDYSPDEALWADQAIAYLVDGKIYRRVLYGELWTIMPGKGWFALVYATLLETFGIDIRVGRSIGIFFDMATYAMIFVIARHLYQWRIALISTLLSLLGSTYVVFFDYRPDHYNAVFFLITFFALLKAWHPDTRHRLLWSFLSGLVPTLAMQMHANAIVMSVAVVIFHSFAWLRSRLQPEHRSVYDHKRFVAMIIGAGIGTGIYLVFNVFAVGGITVFLANLVEERTTNVGGLNLRYLSEWSMLELGLSGLAFLAMWHRNSRQDRSILIFFAIFIACITFLDTQHYIVAYRGLFYVFMGFGMAYTVRMLSVITDDNHLRWLTGVMSIAFFASFTLPFALSGQVQNTLRTGQLPDHRIHEVADEIASRLSPDELVISTHEIIWGLGKRDNFYTEAAQIHRARIWGITPAEVWERIAPDTVVYIEGRMPMPDELATYIAGHMVVCEQYPSYGYQVIFYRVVCDGSQ